MCHTTAFGYTWCITVMLSTAFIYTGSHTVSVVDTGDIAGRKYTLESSFSKAGVTWPFGASFPDYVATKYRCHHHSSNSHFFKNITKVPEIALQKDTVIFPHEPTTSHTDGGPSTESSRAFMSAHSKARTVARLRHHE